MEQLGVGGTTQVAGREPQPAEKLLKVLPKLLHDQLGVTAGLLEPQATLSEPKVPPGFTHASGVQSVGLLPSPRQKGVDVEGSWKYPDPVRGLHRDRTDMTCVTCAAAASKVNARVSGNRPYGKNAGNTLCPSSAVNEAHDLGKGVACMSGCMGPHQGLLVVVRLAAAACRVELLVGVDVLDGPWGGKYAQVRHHHVNHLDVTARASDQQTQAHCNTFKIVDTRVGL